MPLSRASRMVTITAMTATIVGSSIENAGAATVTSMPRIIRVSGRRAMASVLLFTTHHSRSQS